MLTSQANTDTSIPPEVSSKVHELSVQFARLCSSDDPQSPAKLVESLREIVQIADEYPQATPAIARALWQSCHRPTRAGWGGSPR
ncbi:MAG: hypothetical protein Q7S37_04380 [bacterium]|nr:hypothetical protein [bacterium]